jgi:hypothetical protein
MGIYESSARCGCRFISTTYSDPMFVPCLTEPCSKHNCTVGNTLMYNLANFKRRHGIQDCNRKDYRTIKVIERIVLNRCVIIKFDVELTENDFSTFRNPVYYSDYGHEPSFQRGRSYLIDIFDLDMVRVSE